MITAISPIDGRYADKTSPLIAYFSEFALIKYRLKVEIDYFLYLHKIKLPGLKKISEKQIREINNIYDSFDVVEAQKIKDIEKTTNHDVKALEYYIKKKLSELNINDQLEFVHFGLTSQDINNTAIPLSLKECTEKVFIPKIDNLLSQLEEKAKQYKGNSMLARTHGQPASPTDMGKEWTVWVVRLKKQVESLKSFTFYGKFGGATGNFNAHTVSYPHIDWFSHADQFLAQLGLARSTFTTQIDHYDNLAEFFHQFIRINTILIDFCRDIWTYIAMEYFMQKAIAGEIGSSAMPHKVNPIDFENAEGNLAYANAIASFFAEKLPISRLQRDLTDSTVLRNIGTPLAHTFIAILSIQKGLSKLEINREKLSLDLSTQWVILAEAIQTILRREGIKHPYELLKDLTRGNKSVTKELLHEFIQQLPVKDTVKEELMQITPHNYTGRWDILR